MKIHVVLLDKVVKSRTFILWGAVWVVPIYLSLYMCFGWLHGAYCVWRRIFSCFYFVRIPYEYVKEFSCAWHMTTRSLPLSESWFGWAWIRPFLTRSQSRLSNAVYVMYRVCSVLGCIEICKIFMILSAGCWLCWSKCASLTQGRGD